MAYENLLYEVKDAIAYITFNRPKVLNALNNKTMEELDACVGEAGRDESVRAIILTGAGEKAFVAGADINELARHTPVAGKEATLFGQGVLRRLETVGKPSIAALNGFALGGGCGRGAAERTCAICQGRELTEYAGEVWPVDEVVEAVRAAFEEGDRRIAGAECHPGRTEVVDQAWQESRGDVAVHQSGVQGIAYRGPLYLGIENHFQGGVLVGAFIYKQVANANTAGDDRDAAVFAAELVQRRTPTRDQHIDVFVHL